MIFEIGYIFLKSYCAVWSGALQYHGIFSTSCIRTRVFMCPLHIYGINNGLGKDIYIYIYVDDIYCHIHSIATLLSILQ